MKKLRKEDSWVERYYEALYFLFWEPQHLGRMKNDNAVIKNFDAVQKRLRKIEPILNNILKQFLSLAPLYMRNKVFEIALEAPVSGEFIMSGLDTDKEYKLQNSTQPDFLFTTDVKTISMEMKIESKTNIEQVLKYALLALAVEMHNNNQEMDHSLIFLAKEDFASLWNKNERFNSVNDLLQFLRDENLNDQKLAFIAKVPKHFRLKQARFLEIVNTLKIGFISYKSLSNYLDSEVKPTGRSADSQVLYDLVEGLVNELKCREL